MERYQRQIPMIGEEGQKRLEASKAAVAGLGGLGCNVITHLAAAGVGNFILIDGQCADESNLNRQFVYDANDISRRKTERSAEWIRRLNPAASVEEHHMTLNDRNTEVMRGCDLIVDCLDNRDSRMAVNRFAFRNGIKLVHGGVESLFGQVTVVIPGETPCLECILPDTDMEAVSSLSPMVGTIGSIQALEAVKVLAGVHSPLSGRLLSIDASDNSYRVIPIKKRNGCGCCSAKN
ncbi:MAG: HesA/MoeB/ThiF family protein [Methanomassiliicoccaceae archaeon]|jgi:adenylyltransferase/sulfurtransferase|nr:HesA/MoeB/ThiF family protein [Methanomassiliicoccaceae archaeon]